MWDKLNFLKRKPAQPRIRVIEVEAGKLTIDLWRLDAVLCGQAKGALESPLLRRMVQTLNNSHPAFNVFSDVPLNDRIVHQARCEGYTMALRDLELLGEHQRRIEVAEPSFEDEEIGDAAKARFRVPVRQRQNPTS